MSNEISFRSILISGFYCFPVFEGFMSWFGIESSLAERIIIDMIHKAKDFLRMEAMLH